MLQLKNVCKKFGRTVVLNQINLSIDKNTVTGLAGISGSGKSTLLRCIQKLEPLDSGIIELKGKSGFIFQDFQLFPHMNVLKNLLYASGFQKNKKDSIKKADWLLKTLGIENKAEVLPHALSGGQKQRVALARSVMIQPDLLLCDEPTSGLDRACIHDVISLFGTVRDLGMTLIVASHDLEFLNRIAERVVVLESGNLVY